MRARQGTDLALDALVHELGIKLASFQSIQNIPPYTAVRKSRRVMANPPG
jgi:hypothetical protein